MRQNPERFDSSKYPVLWVQSGSEVCARINFLFARKYLTRFVIRLTGGCALMDPGHARMLSILRGALEGFTGVGLFGGTSVRNRENPLEIIDTVTEVFPAVQSRMLRLGIVPKVVDMHYSPYGMVVSDNDSEWWFTTMNYRADALLMIQPSADRHAIWDDEYKECVRIVNELQKVGWGSLLIVFNGGLISEKEILTWGALGRENPGKWNVLLIEGSGRMADRYAADKEFLERTMNVKTVPCTPEALRDALAQFISFQGGSR